MCKKIILNYIYFFKKGQMMNFINDKQILALPIDKKAFHKDLATKNLYLEISPKKNLASKTFYFRYRKNKKIQTIKIGKYPLVSLSAARIKALEYNNKLDLGEVIEQTNKKSQNLEEVFKEWFNVHSKNKKNADFAKPLENHIIKKYAQNPIDKLSKQDILNVFDKLYAEGKRETIKRVYLNLKKLLQFAINKDLIEYSNILNIDLNSLYGSVKPKSFKAITDISRFKELLLAIENYKGNVFTKVALQISPYIFLRSANMRNLEWSEIDFTNKRIVITANKIKAKEEFIVPLSQTVIKYFEYLKPFSWHLKYVFPSDISKSRAMGENTLLQALKRLGFGEEMVYHGFRTTASTLLYENKQEHKQDSEVIELCLDHRERNKVKAVYNRSLRMNDRIKLMKWWSDFLDKLKKI